MKLKSFLSFIIFTCFFVSPAWSLDSVSPAARMVTLTQTDHEEIIDPRSGRLFLRATDVVVKAGPVFLKVQRVFHSQKAKPGLLGKGWLLNWDSTLSRAGSFVFAEDAERPTLFEQEKGKNVFKSRFGDRLVLKNDGKAVRSNRDGDKAFYGGLGRLLYRQDTNGNKIVLHYDKDGRLTRVDGPRGVYLKLHNNQNGLVTLVSASTGAQIKYEYSQTGRLAEVSVNRGTPVKYAYDDKGNLIRIERPMTGTVKLAYDARGRVTSRRWADGSGEFYEYDDANNTVRHISPSGGITSIKRTKDGMREEITDPLGNKTAIVYDSKGRPVAVTGPNGSTSHIKYDGHERLAEVKGCCGNNVRFDYLGNTSIYKSITQADGTRQEFGYDTNGNLVAVRAGKEVVFEATYYPGCLVKSFKGLNIPERRFTYYSNGLTKLQTNALNHTITYEYDKQGNLIRETDPSGGITKRTYDEQSRLLSLTDPAGRTWRYEYDAASRGVKVINPAEGVFRYEYDERGRLLSMSDPMERATRYNYDPEGRIISMVYPGGGFYRYTYDAAGKLVTEINPLGGTTTRSYNLLGLIVSESYPHEQTWKYRYSNMGLLTEIIDPFGGVTAYGYNDKGLIKELVGPLKRITSYEYDDQGRVTRILFPYGAEITYTYDRKGNLIKEADNRGVENKYEYDALGRLINERRAQGFEINYRYDTRGNLLEWQDNLGGAASFRYNSQGLISAMQNVTGASNQYVYDLSGRLLEVTNPLGHVVRRSYTKGGDLSQVKQPSGDTIRYSYDISGALSEIHHPSGGMTRFAYDPMGNRIESMNPLGLKTHNVYDKSGRLVSFTDAMGQTTTFTYDRAGRLVQKGLADGKTVSYRYDLSGNLLEVDDGVFPVHYAYDRAGRLIRKEYLAIKRALKYKYDEKGRLLSFIDSEGRKLSYGYDKYGRLKAIKIPKIGAIKFSYNARDRLTSITYPNGVKGTYEYDRTGRPVKISYVNKAMKSVADWNCTYDSADNPIKVVEFSGKETLYRYNTAGQLTEEIAPGRKIIYDYLPGGNRSKMEGKGKVIQYSYNKADQLLKAGEENFKYDANGNLIERQGSEGVTKYTYNSENRLVQVALPDSNVVSFGYAPTGERIWRKDKSGLTWFVTDGVNLLAELDESLKPKASYLQGPDIDRPLMLSRSGQNYYCHSDLLGSIAALTDQAGKVSASYKTDAFGNIIDQKGTIQNPFIFTGREYEPDLGLYYYRARFYDPALGRFLSEDPEWTPAKLNKYAYALNAPTRYRDPLGLQEDPVLSSQLARHGLTEKQFTNKLVNPNLKKLEIIHKEILYKHFKTPKLSQELLNNWARGEMRNQLKALPENLKGERGVNIIRTGIARSLRAMRGSKKVKSIDWGEFDPLGSTTPSSSGSIPPQGTVSDPEALSRPSLPGQRTMSEPLQPPPGQGPRTPGPLTRGRASFEPPREPSLMGDLTDPDFINRPLTPRETYGMGVLTALLLAEYLDNAYYNDLPWTDDVKNLALGLAGSLVVFGVGVSLVGATPVIVAGLALTTLTHVTAPFEAYDEWVKWGKAEKNERIARQFHEQWLKDNIEKAPDVIKAAMKNIDADIQSIVNKAQEACAAALTAAEKAYELGDEAEYLLSKISTGTPTEFASANTACQGIPQLRSSIEGLLNRVETYTDKVERALVIVEGKAEKCKSEAEADQIRNEYQACDGLVRGILTLSAQAKAKKAEIDRIKAEANRLSQSISSAVSAKFTIIDKANQALQKRTIFDAKSREFHDLNKSIRTKQSECLGKINRLQGSFNEVPPGDQKTELLQKSQEAMSKVKSYKEAACDLTAAKTKLDSGIQKAVSAKLDAESRFSSEIESYSTVLSNCSGVSVDDLMGAISDGYTRALQAMGQHSDILQKAAQCEESVASSEESKPPEVSEEDVLSLFGQLSKEREAEVAGRRGSQQSPYPPGVGRYTSRQMDQELKRTYEQMQEGSTDKEDDHKGDRKTTQPRGQKKPPTDEGGGVAEPPSGSTGKIAGHWKGRDRFTSDSCGYWSASGTWHERWSSSFSQRGSNFNGTVSFGKGGAVRVTVKGTIKGNNFNASGKEKTGDHLSCSGAVDGDSMRGSYTYTYVDPADNKRTCRIKGDFEAKRTGSQ